MTLVAGAAATCLAAAASPGRVREHAAELLRDPAWQKALPGDRTPPTVLDLPLGPLATLVHLLFYAGLAVLAVLAAVWLVRRLSGGARDVVAAGPIAPAAPVAIPIESAEAHAAAGRYGDAIHALLLETLAALSRAARLERSLTSREIVARVPLAAAARDALGALVAAVEISRFGGAVPDSADYRRCLDRFHAFLGTYRSAA